MEKRKHTGRRLWKIAKVGAEADFHLLIFSLVFVCLAGILKVINKERVIGHK